MATWTYSKWKNDKHLCAVVSAENIEIAKIKLKEEMDNRFPNVGHVILNIDLIPLPVSTRKVRILGYFGD
jgi:hypothetical protein